MITSDNPVLIDYVPLTHKESIKNKLYAFPGGLKQYLSGLFPIFQWIHRYNFSWLVQDVIAGITVGMLIVPQGIAYAKVANLDPQYGLYTSFVGVTLYCFFGTSKDISIGPITVVSLLVGQAISKVIKVHPEISGPEVAVCLSLFAGIVTLLMGLIRLGILVDFISEPAIAGYMTGSAITISLGQWPKVFGLKAVNTHNPPYLIAYSFFKHLGETKLDAAFGLTALVALYIIKLGGTRLANQFPILKKPLFFLNIMRSGLIVILGTIVSYIINVHHKDHPLISIIQKVPAGFDSMAVPTLNMTILKEASGVLPSIIIILVLEHVTVAKSFGRMSNYVIDPNQEILAIGMSNIIGSFFGAYPCTGAFSRTAVMARSGARSPMAGVFSGAVVILALYVLTPAFYYIPESVLGSVVIHAVIDLICGPKFVKALWKASVFEFMIFLIAVLITCFIDVETGIYVSVGLSLMLMLLRLARPSVTSLGRVKLDAHQHHFFVQATSSTSSTDHTSCMNPPNKPYFDPSIASTTNAMDDVYGMDKLARYIYVEENDRNYVKLLDPLPPGVVVIRLGNSILYPNANYVSECIMDLIKSRTRAGNIKGGIIEEERNWNQPIHSTKEDFEHNHGLKPYLEYIVFDFSAVDRLDATAIHTLHAIQEALNRYTGGKSVEWHFCHLINNQVRQLLMQSGFGSLPNQAEVVDITIAAADRERAQDVENDVYVDPLNNSAAFGTSSGKSLQTINSLYDPMIAMANESCFSNVVKSPKYAQEVAPKNIITLLPIDRNPAFHWDVESAVYYISKRREIALQLQNNYSSISITTTY